MSGFRRFDLLDSPFSSLFYTETSVHKPHTGALFPFLTDDHLDFALDILTPDPVPIHAPLDLFPFPYPPPLSLLDPFDGAAELLRLDRATRRTETELSLRSLSDRVAALELSIDRALGDKPPPPEPAVDRRYKWTAEIKGPEKEEGFDKKYKLMAEIKSGGEKNMKWTAEMKGKGRDAPLSRTYTFQKSTSPSKKAKPKTEEKGTKETKEKKEKKEKIDSRVVEIEEPVNHGAIVLRQAFAKRAVNQGKGKKKELSPQDAALIIQLTFRAHLVRRAQVLRELRDLAVAKAKLKELRALFYNFSYRRRIANDAEERQRFSEKIIVLLLTVEAIEGLDFLVRASKRSMVEELEAMLEVVDPQPPGRLASLKRRQFDLPTGGSISKEMARGVAEVVQMLDEDESSVLPSGSS